MDTIADLVPSWERHLRARNLAPRTIASYIEAAHDLDSWLTAERAAPVPLRGICHSDITGYIGGILDRASASYAATKYRRLQQFFRWALDEGEIDDSPMRRLSPPRVPDKPVPIIDGTTVRSLLAVCEGRRFEDRRDTAILRTLNTTSTPIVSPSCVPWRHAVHKTFGQPTLVKYEHVQQLLGPFGFASYPVDRHRFFEPGPVVHLVASALFELVDAGSVVAPRAGGDGHAWVWAVQAGHDTRMSLAAERDIPSR